MIVLAHDGLIYVTVKDGVELNGEFIDVCFEPVYGRVATGVAPTLPWLWARCLTAKFGIFKAWRGSSKKQCIYCIYIYIHSLNAYITTFIRTEIFTQMYKGNFPKIARYFQPPTFSKKMRPSNEKNDSRPKTWFFQQKSNVLGFSNGELGGHRSAEYRGVGLCHSSATCLEWWSSIGPGQGQAKFFRGEVVGRLGDEMLDHVWRMKFYVFFWLF